MKVGILTFHRAHNYGAVLQCYALQQVMRFMGHEVYVIDYKSKNLLSCYKVFDIHRYISRNPIMLVRKTLKELSILLARIRRYWKFSQFIESKLKLCPIEVWKNLGLDMIVIGSDQVWNTKLTKGFDDYYWFRFEKPDNMRVITYGASIEHIWDKSDDGLVRSLLGNFDAVSLREMDMLPTINSLYAPRKAEIVLDPTLIVDRGVWDSIAEKPKTKRPYLLLYQVRESDTAELIALDIAKKNHLEIIWLSARVDGKNSDAVRTSSLGQFLGLIKYAQMVVCSSFHGAVFSLIFKKPFLPVKLNDGKDSRVRNLLTYFNYQNSFDKGDLICPDSDPMDCLRFREVRDASIEFIKQFFK